MSHDASTTSWIVRPAEESDVEALLALHLRVFGRPVRREQRAWKLAQRGPAASVWVAEHEDRLIFQYAGIPVRFRLAGEVTWVMVSVDTMTDPDFRRRGLLTQVGRQVYTHWSEAGIRAVVGLPNEQWGSRAVELGWVRVGELRWWIRWLDPLALAAARLKLPWRRRPSAPWEDPPDLRLDEVREVHDLKPLDDLWPRIAADGVVRDASWYQWRYREAVPAWQILGAWRHGALVGVATFRLDDHSALPTGRIGEVLAVDHQARRALLRGCLQRMQAQGAVRTAALLESRTALEDAALSLGFFPRPRPFTVMGVDLGGGLPQGCLFQAGDFDVV